MADVLKHSFEIIKKVMARPVNIVPFLEPVHIGNVYGFSSIILLLTRQKCAGILDVWQAFLTL
ncbi:MAG: hypothetical protein ACI4JB_00355 [Porcipelethomonas sp.]